MWSSSVASDILQNYAVVSDFKMSIFPVVGATDKMILFSGISSYVTFLKLLHTGDLFRGGAEA